MSDGPLLRGPLGVRKKNGFEERYFLLYKDRLDYHGTEADAAGGGQPRGRLDLRDVEKVEFKEEKLVIHSKDAPAIVLKTATAGSVWYEELCRLTGQAAPSTAHSSARDPGLHRGAGTGEAPGVEARLERPELVEDSRGPPEPEKKRQQLPDQGRSLDLEQARPLWQGYLEVEHKGEEGKRRFFVLLESTLVYYLKEADYALGKEPRGMCVLSSVLAFEDTALGFTLRVKGQRRPLQVRAFTEADLDMWLRHLRSALQPSLGPAFQLHRKLGPEEDKVSESTRKRDEEKGAEKPLFEGHLDHLKGSKNEKKYFVLYEDRFEYFSRPEDRRNGAKPRGSLMMEDIFGVQVSDQGSLIVELGDRRFELRTLGERQEEDAQKWGSAWEQALAKRTEEAASASSAARPSLKKVQPAGEDASTPRGSRIHEGLVSVRRRGTLEQRYAVLSADRLELFASAQASEVGEEPRTRVAVADVQHFETRDGWVVLELSERSVEFRPGDGGEQLEAWRKALEDLFRPDSVGDAADMPSVPFEAVVEAIDNLLKTRHIRARDLIQDPRYNPSKDKMMDVYGLQQVCAEAGVPISVADSGLLMQSMSPEGEGKIDLGQLEALLRSHRRVRTAEDVEKEALRARASLVLLKKSTQLQRPAADERSQQARIDDAVEKARVRFRAATLGCGGVNWAKVFAHYDPQRSGHIDARGLVAIVRREVKISVRELPDAMIEKVFASIDRAGAGAIGHSQFMAWLGLQDEANRAVAEEQAAVRIQAAHRGLKARRRASLLKERRPRKLRQGPFKVQGGNGRPEPRTLFIYEDRLEFVGRDHGHRVMARDLEDVEVLDRGFVLSVRGGAPIRLTGPPSICMEEWLDAFSRVCGEAREPEARANDWDEDKPWSSDGEGGEDPGESQASCASTAASVPGAPRPKAGGRGQEKSAPPANVIWSTPFGGAKGSRAAATEAARQQQQQPAGLRGQRRPGNSLGAAQRQGSPRGARQPPGASGQESPQRHAGARAGGKPGPSVTFQSSPPAAASSSARSRSPGRNRPLARERSPPGRAAAPVGQEPERLLASTPSASSRQESERPVVRTEAPVRSGFLGFEDCGLVVQRYSMLFKDRLDSWELPEHSSTGQPPRGRIALCDVRGIEMVRGGFVLNCKGRKVELFVERVQDIAAWSGALHSVVLGQYDPLQLDRPRSTTPKPFVPRVASVPPPAHQFTPGPPGPASLCSRPPSREGVRINTHKDCLQANLLLHGRDAVAFHGGRQAVSAKVNERERFGSLIGRLEPAEKVTGRPHITPRREGATPPPAAKITGDRALSPRREQPVSTKITGERSRSPDRSPECHRCLAPPITDLGREPSSRLRSTSPPVRGKITDCATSYGSPRSRGTSDLDKMRSFGVPSSHHATGVAWSWSAQ